MLKIDLEQFPSHKVTEILSNEESLKFLFDNNIFIYDLDFIQDFSGLNNKEEVITWLLINRDFRMQRSYDLATHTIVDSDFEISRKCLTFIKHLNNGVIRFKFNNKFFQILKAPLLEI